MPRVKRNKINFGARKPRAESRVLMPMNHVVYTVKRNEDLYSFIAIENCILEELFLRVSSLTEISEFPLELYLYDGVDFIKKNYVIKAGINSFTDGKTRIKKGEIVRMDIPQIEDYYEKIGRVTIAVSLSHKASV